jgi:hypothetical protein
VTVGLSVDEASALLAAQFQGVAYAVTGHWIQLHTADPGAAGTANICALSARADASGAFGTDPVPGSGIVTITSDAPIGVTEWAAPGANETPAFASRWSASSGGTFLGSGALSAGNIVSGSPFQLDAGDLTATYPVAA